MFTEKNNFQTAHLVWTVAAFVHLAFFLVASGKRHTELIKEIIYGKRSFAILVNIGSSSFRKYKTPILTQEPNQ